MNSAARTRLARFYRSRPLIGGALILLSGIEIFLSTQLDLGAIHVQVGIEGFQSVLIPVALAVLGALVIADPAHRLFYGVIALAIAIYALIGVNLGGFMIGSILGIVGGVVAVSWMAPRPSESDDAVESADAVGSAHAVEPADTADDAVPAEPLPFLPRPADTGRRARQGARALAIVGAVALGAGAFAAAVPAEAARAESPLCDSVLGVLCPASPELTPGATETASPSPTAALSPTPPPPPSPSTEAPAPTAPTMAPTLRVDVPLAAQPLLAPQAAAAAPAIDASAPVVAAQTATLSASYLSQTNGRYVDTVLLRRPDGSTVPALKILGDSGLLKDVRLHGSGSQHGAGIDATRLDVAGPIHFYAASFSGKAFGLVPVRWDVASPPPAGIPMPPFTDVTVELVYFDAGGQTLTAAHITPE